MTFVEKIKGCLTLGAIGDCIGGFYEGIESVDNVSFTETWQI